MNQEAFDSKLILQGTQEVPLSKGFPSFKNGCQTELMEWQTLRGPKLN